MKKLLVFISVTLVFTILTGCKQIRKRFHNYTITNDHDNANNIARNPTATPVAWK